jgi:hypothetical protein
MKINQDTFRDDELDFGGNKTSQRDTLWVWRWSTFIELFEKDYPEVWITIIGIPNKNRWIVADNLLNLTFEFKHKLHYGLSYEYMESLNSSEFDKTIIKFKNYLAHSTERHMVRNIGMYRMGRVR